MKDHLLVGMRERPIWYFDSQQARKVKEAGMAGPTRSAQWEEDLARYAQQTIAWKSVLDGSILLESKA